MKLILVAGKDRYSADFAEMLRCELLYYYRDVFSGEKFGGTALYLIDLDMNSQLPDDYVKRSHRCGAIFYSRNPDIIKALELTEKQAAFVRPFLISEFITEAGRINDVLKTANFGTYYQENSGETNIDAESDQNDLHNDNISDSGVKPENPNEKISSNNAGDSLIFGQDGSTVCFRGVRITLTRREYELLYYLFSNRGKAVSRNEAVNEVWRYDFTGNTNIVEVYIRYLRKKIDERFDVKLIRTVRGYGYIIK